MLVPRRDGLPRLDGAAGWAACELQQTVEAGDHLLLIGLVTHAASVAAAAAVYGHRTFGTHSRSSIGHAAHRRPHRRLRPLSDTPRPSNRQGVI